MTKFSSTIIIALALLASMAFLNSKILAQESITVTGFIKTTYDEDDNLWAVDLLMEDDANYCITLDDKGRELGEDYDDQWVEVTGVLVQKDDENWITIKSFRLADVIEDEDEEWLEDEELAPEDEEPWPEEDYE